MKSFPTKQRVPDYVRDRFHDSNSRSLGSSYHNVRGYNQQQPPYNYVLPKKIISNKFNPPKQHQQQQRYRYAHSKPPSNPNSNAGLSSSTLSCYVCNKSFPSSQFLYSHMMRLHPERGMKGVLPPQQAPVLKSVMPSQSQPSNERDVKQYVLQPPQATISLTKSVVSSPSRSSSASEYSSDVTESNCGSAKLLLSSWGKKDRRGRTNNNPSSCYCTSNVAIGSLPKPMEATTTSSTSIPSTKNTIIANEHTPNKRSCTTGNEIGLIENKMMKMTKRYECNICHKEFDTGQALGGHKSSSSACKAVREPKLLESAVDHHHPPQLAVSTTENTTMEGVVVLTTKKTMYEDIEEGEIVEDGEIIDEEGTTQGSTNHQPRSHIIFDFDLNELPPEE